MVADVLGLLAGEGAVRLVTDEPGASASSLEA